MYARFSSHVTLVHQAHLRPQEYKCHHLCDGIFSKIKSFIGIHKDDVTVLNLWLMLPVHLSDLIRQQRSKTFWNHAKKETPKKTKIFTCNMHYCIFPTHNTFRTHSVLLAFKASENEDISNHHL